GWRVWNSNARSPRPSSGQGSAPRLAAISASLTARNRAGDRPGPADARVIIITKSVAGWPLLSCLKLQVQLPATPPPDASENGALSAGPSRCSASAGLISWQTSTPATWSKREGRPCSQATSGNASRNTAIRRQNRSPRALAAFVTTLNDTRIGLLLGRCLQPE